MTMRFQPLLMRGVCSWYADRMSTKRITISVPADVAARIKRAAGTQPVSTWVTELVEDHLDDAELERQWQEFYESVNPRPRDKRKAATMLSRLVKRKRRRAA